jgi:AcrR family transcriptional regulator
MGFLSLTSGEQRSSSPRAARSIKRILDAAAHLFGAQGFEGASMNAVARAAGVSKGLLHYHFESKEHLLIEAQRATFHQIHLRFEERFKKGDRGIQTALDGIDTLWSAVCDMRAWAPFIVQTMSLAGQNRPIRGAVDDFLNESMTLLERGIRNVFIDELSNMAVPPHRLAMLIRTALHGLVVELSYARTPFQLSRVDQAYQDFRNFFGALILQGPLVQENIA